MSNVRIQWMKNPDTINEFLSRPYIKFIDVQYVDDDFLLVYENTDLEEGEQE